MFFFLFNWNGLILFANLKPISLKRVEQFEVNSCFCPDGISEIPNWCAKIMGYLNGMDNENGLHSEWVFILTAQLQMYDRVTIVPKSIDHEWKQRVHASLTYIKRSNKKTKYSAGLCDLQQYITNWYPLEIFGILMVNKSNWAVNNCLDCQRLSCAILRCLIQLINKFELLVHLNLCILRLTFGNVFFLHCGFSVQQRIF